LADLSKRDLSNPTDAATKTQLAEGWATWASKNSEENIAAWQRAQWWLNSSDPDPRRRRPNSKPTEIELTVASRMAEFGNFLPHWRGFDYPPGEAMRLDGHTTAVRAIAVSRTGRFLVSGSIDSTTRVWDLTTGQEVSRMPALDNVMSLALLPDEQTIMMSGITNKVVSVNLVTRAEVGSFEVEGSLRDMVISADGRRMLQWRGAAPRVLIVSEINGAKPALLPTPTDLRAIDLGRSGAIAAGADDTNTVHLWDLRKPAPPASLTGFSSSLADIAISPNEQRIAACYSEGIVIWDVPTRQETLRISLPRSGQRIVFSCDSRRLITSPNTNEITIVDVVAGTIVKTLTTNAGDSSGSVEALAVLPDGRGAVTAGADGPIRVWRLPD
jgi:WD40 repeat protein